MIKYCFKECLPANQTAEINVSTKFRSTPHSIEHSHDFYELILVCQGGLLHALNGKEVGLYKYDLCIICPNEVHISSPEEQDQPPSYYTISIRADYFEKLTSAINVNFLSLLSVSRYTTVKSQVFEQCKQLLNQALFLPTEKTDKKQLIYQTVVAKLLTEFTIDTSQKKQSSSLVEAAYSLMLDNNNIHLSINDVAKKLGYSEEHLIRVFKKHNEQSPSKVFTKIKLDYAGELLIATDYSIAYICDLIGYYSQHYFNKIFKNHFGCPPSVYRKKNSIPF